jgi:hypothetical protein
MPVKIKKPPMILALSPNGVATALGIRSEQVYEAIQKGELIVRVKGIRRRVLIKDVEAWVEKTWPEAPKRKNRKVVPDAG